MSIQEFTSLLRDEAYKKWFKASNTNILSETVTKLREAEESAEKTDFIITKTTVSDVIAKLNDSKATEEQINTVLTKLKATRPKFYTEVVEKNADGSTKEVYLKFVRVNLEQIGRLVNKGFEDQINESGNAISDFFQRGHVMGVATNLVKQTRFGVQQSSLTSKQKDLLVGFLDDYIAKLTEDDIATSNLKDPEHAIYAKYSKNYRRYIVELQPKALNQESGRSVVPITASLRKYFKPENYVELSEKNFSKVSDDNFFKKLITTKGSPSFEELLLNNLGEVLSGKPQTDITYSTKDIEVARIKTKINSTDQRNQVKSEIQKAKQLKKQITSAKVRTPTGQFYSIANLQTLLNELLPKQIEKNMGKGDSRVLLNYRSGRLAESAQVERLSVSREGMISAFYTYMRNPYGTFSTGGAQSQPPSRDPKLLIAKSIREIAQMKVSNRMRAILV